MTLELKHCCLCGECVSTFAPKDTKVFCFWCGRAIAKLKAAVLDRKTRDPQIKFARANDDKRWLSTEVTSVYGRHGEYTGAIHTTEFWQQFMEPNKVVDNNDDAT